MGVLRAGILAIMWLLCLAHVGVAQDLKNALLDMRKEYEGLNSIHINMEMKVFGSETEKTPLYTDHIDIKRDGSNYCYTLGRREMLMNECYLIVVDKESREIVVGNRSLEDEKELSKQMVFNIDSVLNLYKDAAYMGTVEDIYHFKITQKQGVIGRIDLYISSKTSMLTRIDYLYNQGQYVLIEFKEFEKHPSFNERSFDESRYIVNEKNVWKPAEEFRSYKIITRN